MPHGDYGRWILGVGTQVKEYVVDKEMDSKVRIYTTNRWRKLFRAVPEYRLEDAMPHKGTDQWYEHEVQYFMEGGRRQYLDQFPRILNNPWGNGSWWMQDMANDPEFNVCGHKEDSFYSGLLVAIDDDMEMVKVYTFICS